MDMDNAHVADDADGDNIPNPTAATADAALNPEIILRRKELQHLRDLITDAIGGVSHYVVPDTAYEQAQVGVVTSYDSNAIDLPDDIADGEAALGGKGLVAYDGGDGANANDDESEDSDSSETSCDTSSVDQEPLKVTEHRSNTNDVDEDDDIEEGAVPRGPLRTAHEEPMSRLPLPPIPYLLTLPHQHLEFIGQILHVYRTGKWDDDFSRDADAPAKSETVDPSAPVDQSVDAAGVLTVVIQGLKDSRPLDEGTLLALADGRIFGCVEDVFGPVAAPCYLLRVMARNKYSKEQLEAYREMQLGGNLTLAAPSVAFVTEADVKPAIAIHAVKEAAKYIYPEQLRAQFPKGSDASNFWDEEVAQEEQEYSDDEEEQRAAEKRRLMKRNRQGQPRTDLDAVRAIVEGTADAKPKAKARSTPAAAPAATATAAPIPMAAPPFMQAAPGAPTGAPLTFAAAMMMQQQMQLLMMMQMQQQQQQQQRHHGKR